MLRLIRPLKKKINNDVAQLANRTGVNPLPHVLLMTDRNDERTTNLADRFGSIRDINRPLTCASVNYKSPPSREMGSTQTVQYSLGNDLRTGDKECLSLVKDVISRDESHNVLFFIHGYKTSAEAAVLEATDLALDMKFLGTVLVWSWPSDGYASSYLKDEETAAFITPTVAMFLSTLLGEAKDAKFELIAHSMGSRILLGALLELARTALPSPLNSVVFAAPDVAQDIFRSQLVRVHTGDHGSVYQLATLYASDADRALKVSETAHRGARAGSAGQDLIVMSEIETIDTSPLSSWLKTNHGYIFEEPRAIRDLGFLIVNQFPAAQRLLDDGFKNSIKYWRLR